MGLKIQMMMDTEDCVPPFVNYLGGSQFSATEMEQTLFRLVIEIEDQFS